MFLLFFLGDGDAVKTGLTVNLTVVNEPPDPLPEIQTRDPRRGHIAATINQVLDQTNVLVYHGDVERSET